MREYTWLDRPSSWSNVRAFQAVVERVRLASAWLSSHQVGFSESVFRHPWINWIIGADQDLSRAFPLWCDSMIGGRTPEEALVEFSRMARQYEASVAKTVLNLDSLDSVSRRCGFEAGKRSGNEGHLTVSDRIPSLGWCAGALRQSALGWLDWPSQERPLVERDIPGRLDGVLQECPHQDPILTDPVLSDWLCAQHLNWFQGWCDSLDPRISVHARSREPMSHRCRFTLAWNQEGKT